MSRWHKGWCTIPDVVVKENVPTCDSCASTASPDIVIAERVNNTATAITMPPDEPTGNMRLHWPPELPWSTRSDSLLDVPPNAHSGSQQYTNAMPPLVNSVSVSPILPVYERSLNSDQIRLMVLDCGEPGFPIHVSLEVFEQDNCPEYETVSYTWAGEDGQTIINNVIYVGTFWDIMPQTFNCWSLLQYLRPVRGIRTVWVDAICINQNDVIERGVQVAKMGEIYSLCFRVVIWLGYDVVTKSAKTYRQRRPFEDIDKHVSLEELFSRRYFTRVWIMQELLLAPYSIVPFREKDFHAGPSTIQFLINRIGKGRWEDVGKPWLLHLNASSRLPKQDLFNSLRNMVSPDLGATDRRDLIFGILGLIRCKTVLVPDYSLSFRATVIGVSAYFLIHLTRLEILFHAGTERTIPSYPSWVPDWTTSWFQLNDTMDASLDTRWSNDIPQGFMGIYCPRARGFGRIRDGIPRWNSNASIDVSTASLTMNLCHLFKISSRPLRNVCDAGIRTSVSGGGFSSISCFVFSARSCELMLYCDTIPLDELIEPGVDHIFLIEHGKKSRYLMLLMRQLKVAGHYRLIISWSCYDLVLVTKTAPRDLPDLFRGKTPTRNLQFHTYVDPWKSLADAISDVRWTCKFSPHYTHDTSRPSNNCNECDQALLILEQILPGTAWTLSFAFRIFQSILEELKANHDNRYGQHSWDHYDNGTIEKLSPAFVTSLRQAFEFYGQEVDDQWIYASISPRQWKDGPHCQGLWEVCESESQKTTLQESWNNGQYYLPRKEESRHVNNEKKAVLKEEILIHLRLSVRVLFDQVRFNSAFFNAFKNLRFYRSVVRKSEMDMALNKDEVDHTTIYPRCWPQVAVDELGLDATKQQVVIE